jgi:tripartite ATP-independent transporter DctP family solute receptor
MSLSATILCFAGLLTSAAAAEFQLKAGHVLAPDHPYNLGLLKMKELVEERSGGRIGLDVFPSSQLGGERELAEACQMGTIDIALVTAPLASFDSNFYIFDIPALFVSKAHAYKFLDGPDGKAMMDGLAQQNIKGLAFWETGFFNIFDSKRPLNTPEDLKGLNIRTMENPAYIAYFSALGANPVPMAYGEIYTALQNGTVDGTLIPIASIYTSKFHLVAPYVSRTQNWYCPTPLIMSLDKWEAMPGDLQGILQRCADEGRDYMRKLLTDNEDAQIEQMKKDGSTIVEVDKKIWFDNAGTDAVVKLLVPDKVKPELVEKVRVLVN